MSSASFIGDPLAIELGGARFLLDERASQLVRLRRAGEIPQRGWIIRRALVLADTTALALAFTLGGIAGSGVGVVATRGFWQGLVAVGLLMPLWILAAKVYGLYDRDGRHASYSTTDDLGPIANLTTLTTLLFLFSWHALQLGGLDWSRVAATTVTAVPLIAIGHGVARRLVRRNIGYLQNTVIVGAGDVGQLIAHKFLQHPETGINIVGFVDSAPKERRDDLGHLALLGDTEQLPALVALLDIERAVLAFSNETDVDMLNLIRELRDLNVQVDIVPRLFDLIGPGVSVHSIEGVPLIGLESMRLSRSSRLVKRCVDLVVAGVATLVLSPVLALIALAIKIDSAGPVIFKQIRMGEAGEPFEVLKFRTMWLDADKRKHEFAHLNRHLGKNGDPRMFKIENDPRVTRTGRILRKYFLDELPQLFNVLRGEMSLIGPRPLILDEARYVDDWGHRRLDLKPGMTGIWQVLGRSAISFEEMVKLDYLYVTTWSLGNDLRLLLRTIPLVAHGDRPV